MKSSDIDNGLLSGSLLGNSSGGSSVAQSSDSLLMGDISSVPDGNALYAEMEGALAEEKEGSVFFNHLASHVTTFYTKAKADREQHEDRWLRAFRNYRGVYGKGVRFRESEKSRVFIKATKTKVLAGYGQLVEIVFGGSRFPISIRETLVPEGTAESLHVSDDGGMAADIEGGKASLEGYFDEMENTPSAPSDTEALYASLGWVGDDNALPPGATHRGMVSDGVKRIIEASSPEADLSKLKPGESPDPTKPTIKPAQMAARRMEKLIHDQIDESNGSVELRSALFEACLLGSGVIKGPFNYNKTLHKWEGGEGEERVYAPSTVRVPRIEFVSLWDFFPDGEASNMDEAVGVVQRHKMNKSEMRALKSRPFFDLEEVGKAIEDGPNYINEDWELSIRADDANTTNSNDRWEVLEYWGTIDKEILLASGVNVEGIDIMDEVQMNVWVCNGRVLRAVSNPFVPARIPYLIFPYERNPYSIFGIGIAENMEDSQMIMNGHARMAIDNLALAGNLVFDVDENALAPGENMEIYPGKVFKRVSGVPGQSIYAIKFPSTTQEHMAMFDKFRQLADEATGMPSYSHGQTGVSGMTRTASGMSMLMGAASQNVKTVVTNLDDFLLKPLGEAMFQWNMAFYEGELAVVGDLEVKANGVHSLMQKEVRSQRLMTLLQLTQNPALIPFIKMPTLIKEVAYSTDIDPDELINDVDMATVMQMLAGQMAQQGMPQAPPGANPADPTGAGGGQIGVGQAPMPQEAGFSAADMAQGAPQ